MTGLEIMTTFEIVSKFKDLLIKGFKMTSDEVNSFFGKGVEEYLQTQHQKYAFTKTFLYRETPVDFYTIFFPVSIKKANHNVNTDEIFKLIQNTTFLAIIGTAGSGKTMLMKHIFLNSFQEAYKIPIVIELRNLNTYEEEFSDYIFKMILKNKISPSDGIMKRMLEEGKFIFLLDGYDEIYSDKKQKITDEIDFFIDGYSKNNFVLSSRPGANIESMPRFACYSVNPLSDTEIIRFIEKQLQYHEDPEVLLKIKSVVSENKEYRNFLQNPLLLSMFILTYQDHPELPKTKSLFYYNVFDTLYARHDTLTKKGGFQHEKKTGLKKEDFLEFLKFFSLQSFFEGFFTFDKQYFEKIADKIKKYLKLDFSSDDLLYDLTVSISILIQDGIYYTFPHRSLQEYFAALCIANEGAEFKRKVYEEKFTAQLSLARGGNDNFWNMCVELDGDNFYSIFVIPKVRQMFSEFPFNPQGDKVTFAGFFLNNLSISHQFRIEENGTIRIDKSSSFRLVHTYIVALSLIKSPSMDIWLNTENETELKGLLKKFVDEGLFIENRTKSPENRSYKIYKVQYSSLPHIKLIELLNLTTIPDQILAKMKQIQKAFESLERQVKENIANKISLLE